MNNFFRILSCVIVTSFLVYIFYLMVLAHQEYKQSWMEDCLAENKKYKCEAIWRNMNKPEEQYEYDYSKHIIN